MGSHPGPSTEEHRGTAGLRAVQTGGVVRGSRVLRQLRAVVPWMRRALRLQRLRSPWDKLCVLAVRCSARAEVG